MTPMMAAAVIGDFFIKNARRLFLVKKFQLVFLIRNQGFGKRECDGFSAICWFHRDGDRNGHCNNFTFSLVAVVASKFVSIFLCSGMMNHDRKCIDATLVNSAGSLVSIGRGWEAPLSAGAEPMASQRRALPPGCASLCQRPAAQAGKAFFDVRFSSLRSENLHPVGRVRRVKKSFARLLHKSVDWGKCGAPPPTTNGCWGILKMTLPHHFSRCRLPW